jgi:hypothetical protein
MRAGWRLSIEVYLEYDTDEDIVTVDQVAAMTENEVLELLLELNPLSRDLITYDEAGIPANVARTFYIADDE